MATHTELQMLVEEERVLMRAASKLTAQLTRLKVEELALLSQIRHNNPTASSRVIETNGGDLQNPEEVNQRLVCLDVKSEKTTDFNMVEEEEEDTEEDDLSEVHADQLTTFLQRMENKS